MANRQDGDHHNNVVDNTVHTRAEFLKFCEEACDENQQFREKSQQIIGEIKQMIASFLIGNHLTITMINIFKDVLLTTRKFLSLMELCVSWILLIWLFDLEEYFNFWKICDGKRVWLASNKVDDEA